MRYAFAPLALLCVLIVSPALAQGGPDSIYVPGKGYVERHQLSPQTRHFGTYTRAPKRVAKPRRATTRVAGKTFTPSPSVSVHSSAASWIAEARRYEGRNARQIGLSRTTLWCGTFMGHVASKSGIRAPANPHSARAWANAGRRLSGPQVGAIVVFPRGRNGGHVGIITAVNGNGTIRVISGNHRNRVAEANYPVSRAIAFVWPA